MLIDSMNRHIKTAEVCSTVRQDEGIKVRQSRGRAVIVKRGAPTVNHLLTHNKWLFIKAC